MPTAFELLITARENASAAIDKVDRALKQLDNTAQNTGKSFEHVGTRSENLGRGLARGLQIAQSSLDILAPVIGKISPEFDAATRAAQQFAGVLSLGFMFGPWGVAIAGVTTALGVLIQYLGQEHDALVKVISVSDAYIVRARGMADATEQMSAATRKWVDNELTKLAELKAKQQEYARTSWWEEGAGGAAKVAEETAKAAQDIAQLQASYDALIWSLQSGYEEVERNRSAFDGLGSSARNAAGGIDELRRANEYLANVERNLLITDAQRVDQLELMRAGRGTYGVSMPPPTPERGGGGINRAQQVIDAVRSMVESALRPTEVTAEQMAQAAAGKYLDQWDEFARRAEAVAKGTAPSEYGAEFEKQLAGLGMTAEQAAQGFRDFSLFADPKNLNLVDWGPIVADVQHQIDMLIGKANLAKEAFDQVWESLSPGKKAQLAGALGVDPTDANNAQKVFEAMSGGEAQASAKTTSEIAANIQIISGIHTAIIDVQKSGTFDANLEEILRDLAKIPNGYDVVVTITYTNGGGGGGSETTTPPPNERNMQFGGFGISRGWTTLLLEPGEGWWASGRQWQVPPPVPSGGRPAIYFNGPINVYTRDGGTFLDDLIRKVRAYDVHGI